MAAGTKLNIVFNNADGGTTSYTWNYADPGATKSDVLALGAAMIANTSILASTLVSVKSAKTITTSENVYELDAVSAQSAGLPASIIDTGKSTEGNPELPEEATVITRIPVSKAKALGLM